MTADVAAALAGGAELSACAYDPGAAFWRTPRPGVLADPRRGVLADLRRGVLAEHARTDCTGRSPPSADHRNGFLAFFRAWPGSKDRAIRATLARTRPRSGHSSPGIDIPPISAP